MAGEVGINAILLEEQGEWEKTYRHSEARERVDRIVAEKEDVV